MGIILGPHGTKGEVKVKSFAARGPDFAAYGPLEDEAGSQRFEFRASNRKSAAGRDADIVVARIIGISDREGAAALKGTRLYLERDRLPAIREKNVFYAADLIGMAVLGSDGSELGVVANIAEYGAGPILEIEGGSKGSFAVPFVDRFVPDVDIERARLIVDLPEDYLKVPDAPATKMRGSKS